MNERLQNTLLFLIPSMIWGSTWYVIKFQLGVVSPMLSVAYRFFAAGIILTIGCLALGYKMKFSPIDHLLFLLLGVSLFGINYWMVYEAEQFLTSGLIAVMFSLVVFTNMLLSALMVKTKITLQIFVGGLLAVGGTVLIFKQELLQISKGSDITKAMIMGLGSVFLASFGNVMSAYNQKRKLPVLQANAYGMFYGASVVFIIAMVKQTPLTFDVSRGYILSLIYLAAFGSIVAFTAYLRLIGKIGAPKASYVVIIIPIIAMIFSTIFEDYEWQQSALIGMPVLILGNLIAMDRLKPGKLILKWR